MDLGLGKFLEYFREFFGEKLTKVFIFITALTFVTFCLNIFFTRFVLPITKFLNQIFGDQTVYLSYKEYLLAFVAAIGLGFVATAIGGWFVLIIYSVKTRKLREQRKLELKEAKAENLKAIKRNDEAKKNLLKFAKVNNLDISDIEYFGNENSKD